MGEEFVKEDGNADLWHQIFGDGHPFLSGQQDFHAKLPKDPRCRLCYAPFAGLGGLYMKFRGKKPSERNQHYCNACDGFLEANPGGADVEMSLLFADIRASTSFADGAEPREVSERVNKFLDRATKTITYHDGFVIAFYGDCIVAVWPPGFVGENHAEKALGAARAVVQSMEESEDPIPVGVGVNSGKMFIGTVQAQKGFFRDVSVFGINVNVAARLAGSAEAGQALASEATFSKAGQSPDDFTSMTLKGISDPVSAATVFG